MQIALEPSQESFVKQAVSDGRFANESEVVNLSLRLLEENDRKLADLRTMIAASLSEGGEYTAEDLDRDMEEQDAEFAALGYSE
jgi:antitoxin ParD1/3/4